MQNQHTKESREFRPGWIRLVVGSLSLVALVLAQAFGLGSAAIADSRDEFPGRRQGGGTHWEMPEVPTLH